MLANIYGAEALALGMIAVGWCREHTCKLASGFLEMLGSRYILVYLKRKPSLIGGGERKQGEDFLLSASPVQALEFRDFSQIELNINVKCVQELHSKELSDCSEISKGDLIFFGRSPEDPCQGRPNHVGMVYDVSIMHVRSRPIWHVQYIHSSGKENGRNGVGMDSIYVSDDEDVRKISFFGLYVELRNISEHHQTTLDFYYNPRFRRFGRICSKVKKNACWPGFKPLPREDARAHKP